MKKGTVREFDVTKSYGFTTGEDNEDYFVHVSGLREYLKVKDCVLVKENHLMWILE